MSLEELLFWIFSVGAMTGGLGVVFLRDPIKGALSLIGSFFSIACLYLLQKAELIAVLEVLVYAGAIMVLFVFVIMLVENHDEPILPKSLLRRVLAPAKFLAVAVVTANLLWVLKQTAFDAGPLLPEGFGSAREVGMEFATSFLFQFELASVLLLVAIVGAVMISRKDPPEPKRPEPKEVKH
ncbi:MAG: NADH-quinone oxidoreductase subunit J [Deltaproteobacteria bacterium]|nr:NADH-quinone oxidoreductase subunit J [Deltaproteobacteria bacterium]